MAQTPGELKLRINNALKRYGASGPVPGAGGLAGMRGGPAEYEPFDPTKFDESGRPVVLRRAPVLKPGQSGGIDWGEGPVQAQAVRSSVAMPGVSADNWGGLGAIPAVNTAPLPEPVKVGSHYVANAGGGFARGGPAQSSGGSVRDTGPAVLDTGPAFMPDGRGGFAANQGGVARTDPQSMPDYNAEPLGYSNSGYTQKFDGAPNGGTGGYTRRDYSQIPADDMRRGPDGTTQYYDIDRHRWVDYMPTSMEIAYGQDVYVPSEIDKINAEAKAKAAYTSPTVKKSYVSADGRLVRLGSDGQYRYEDNSSVPPDQLATMQNVGDEYKYGQQIETAMARGRSFAEARAENSLVDVYDTEGNIVGKQIVADVRDALRTSGPGKFTSGTQGVAIKNKEVLVKDINVGLDNTEAALKKLSAPFTEVQRLKMFEAAKSEDPRTAFDNLIFGQFGKSLTPDQMDYIVAAQSLQERIMSMRVLLQAGQGSDAQREAIMRTVPGAVHLFDPAFAQKQIDMARQTTGIIYESIPENFKGGRPAAAPGGGQGASSIPAGAVRKQVDRQTGAVRYLDVNGNEVR